MRKETARVRDMTEGSPVRLILLFAIPMFIGTIFQQIYSVVDTMMAGYNLGDGAIAAIGATSSLGGLIIGLAMSLNGGYAIVVTQCFGAKKEHEMRQAVAGMIWLNLIAAVALTVLALIFMRPTMRLLNTPVDIFEDAHTYIAIICGGMSATICYNMFASILRAVGNSRTPLVFLIVSNLLNMAMDAVLIMGFHLGVAGAALATIFAETVSAVLSAVYTIRHYRFLLPTRAELQVPGKLLWNLFTTGFAMAMMLCVVNIGSVIFQGATNALGQTLIAAHAAARRIIDILMAPLGTIASASATFVGQNWGAKKPERIQYALRRVLGMEVLWGLFACALVYTVGRGLIIFTTGTADEDMIQNAVLSLRIHFPFYAPPGVLLALRTALQGMGRKLVPVISSSIEMVMKVIFALWMIPRVGFLGVCWTEPITWVMCMVFITVVYLTQKKQMYSELQRMEEVFA